MPLFGVCDYSTPQEGGSVPNEETLVVLSDFVREGKVRPIGLSNETPWDAMRFLKLARSGDFPRMVTIQNSYNLLNRTFDSGLSEICHEEGMRVLAYSLPAYERLSGKYRDGNKRESARLTIWERFARYSAEDSDAAIEEYAKIAEEAGLDFAQMSLSWINARPPITRAI